jgi:hypothetical protein
MVVPVFNAESLKKGKFPLFGNVFKYHPETGKYGPVSNKVGLHKVDAVGAAAMFLSRDVFTHPKMQRAFERPYDREGIPIKGPDMFFCEKARKAGFEIWAHFNYFCNHFRECGLLEINDALTYVAGIADEKRRQEIAAQLTWLKEQGLLNDEVIEQSAREGAVMAHKTSDEWLPAWLEQYHKPISM